VSAKNPEYDFNWCPGCGDFGVRRALEFALRDYSAKHETPMAANAVIAGIGCSGNLVHLLEGEQPFGFHGIHGRALPIAFGAKIARPDLNVVTVAGDGDFLSIGMEHIAPQAARNINITAVVMDNGVYGLTKGQASPTTAMDVVTSSTPFGKLEMPVRPLDLYLSLGVTFIASGYSSKPRDLARLMLAGMEHEGFSIVHVASPCTSYNDTYEYLKGNKAQGIEPGGWVIPEDHDPSSVDAASALLAKGGVPMGVVFENTSRPSLDSRLADIRERNSPKSVDSLLSVYAI
jgi:2-oxoglutarate ferredoxin oxidoreductase subunit beta